MLVPIGLIVPTLSFSGAGTHSKRVASGPSRSSSGRYFCSLPETEPRIYRERQFTSALNPVLFELVSARYKLLKEKACVTFSK